MSKICTNCNRFYIFNSSDLCRFCTKEKTDLVKRNKSVSDLMKGICNLVYSNVSFTYDDFIDQTRNLIIETRLKLTDQEVKKIVSMFYNKEKPTRERLDQADNLYREIDHANSMIPENDSSTIGLFYQ